MAGQPNNRNHNTNPHPSGAYGAAGSGDGKTTAATGQGAAQLVDQAKSPQNKVGFSGSSQRRIRKGPIGAIMNFLFGKDPDIFDAQGRVRHKFTDEKWKQWDARLRDSKNFDWRQHSGKKN